MRNPIIFVPTYTYYTRKKEWSQEMLAKYTYVNTDYNLHSYHEPYLYIAKERKKEIKVTWCYWATETVPMFIENHDRKKKKQEKKNFINFLAISLSNTNNFCYLFNHFKFLFWRMTQSFFISKITCTFCYTLPFSWLT